MWWKRTNFLLWCYWTNNHQDSNIWRSSQNYITQKINWVKSIPFHKTILSKIMHWLTHICSFYTSWGPKRSHDVFLKIIPNVKVKNAQDCSRFALLHFISDVGYDVYSFWYFYIRHPIVQKRDTTFWKIILFLKGIGKILLTKTFFDDDQITLLLEFIGWIKSKNVLTNFSNIKRVTLCSGERFHSIQGTLLLRISQEDQVMPFQFLTHRSAYYLVSSILEKALLGKCLVMEGEQKVSFNASNLPLLL